MSWQWVGDQGLQWNPPEMTPQQFLPRVRALLGKFEHMPISGVRELVPGFTSLVFLFASDYRPNAQTISCIQAWVEGIDGLEALELDTLKYVPVWYDGPDLAEVAQVTRLPIDDVIQLHSEPIYTVHFLGFLPGFPYLGGMNPRIACPRRSAPRREVPAGSVGIGGDQTGIYPITSPGGWNLIGRTDVALFSKHQGAYFSVGDRIKFVAQ